MRNAHRIAIGKHEGMREVVIDEGIILKSKMNIF
jgi:hypothetical protein